MKRRSFLKGCCAAAALGVVPVSALFQPLAAGARTSNDVLVYLFLRGGMDGLHLVIPFAGPERWPYEVLRAGLAIPESNLRQINSHWGLHPRAGGTTGDSVGSPPKWLHRLWNEGHLAIVQGMGMPTHLSRSHFDAQAWMDLGTPGSKSTPDGWLTRWLAVASGLPQAAIAPVIGMAGTRPVALIGSQDALTVASPADFQVDGFHWSWDTSSNGTIAAPQGAREHLGSLWSAGSGPLLEAGRATVDALTAMGDVGFDGYEPDGNASYPETTLGRQLKSLAQMIKLDLGLAAATVDYGGWDSHAGQGSPQPGNAGHYDAYGNRVEELSRSLDAFYTDLAASPQGNLMNRVNVVVLSEFGRKIRPNQSAGTDHGHGNVMLALGGRVNGGMHGIFPGLDASSLLEGQDLASTGDFRQLLAEALVARMGLSPGQLSAVFPEMGSYSPLGVFASG